MNIALWLKRAAEKHGDRPAIAIGQSVFCDYHNLAGRSAGLASALTRELGMNKGDHVAIVSSNGPYYLEVLFAIWWAGLVAVPVNSKLHSIEITWILEHSEAGVVFVSDELAQSLGGVQLLPKSKVIQLGGIAYKKMVASSPSSLVALEPNDLAWLFYTSGTTGRPKGAMLSHRNLIAMSLAHLVDVDPTKELDSFLHVAPMSHGSGLLALSQVASAALNVVPESSGFDAIETVELAHRWRNASTFLAPTMIRRILRECAEIDLSAIRTVVWGGAPMLTSDCLEALDRLGPCLAQIYGQGESPMTITALEKYALVDRSQPRWLERVASAGTARSVVEVRIVADQDQPAEPGEIGEILVRGGTVMSGYWHDEVATEEALQDNWLHTGDVGSLDEYGFLSLKDRTKDLVISGGSNVYPREVEEVLASHPAVQEVSVIGRTDAEWGEVVIAYVVGIVDAASLDLFCLERIARFKRPREYVFVSELPKNNYGKILKTKLREIDSRTNSEREAVCQDGL